MQKNYFSLVVLISLSAASLSVRAASFADAVVGYDPGSLSGSAVSFTNATAVLGEPSRVTPGPFGGPVDPFGPPYLDTQLVSVGPGGSVIVGFNSPILNNPSNPYGLDFMIYGNSGFVITNGDFSGGGITDGSLFGNNTGSTRVSVSADSLIYFTLSPSRAPVVDGLYPTDGGGDFTRAVNPALGKVDFSDMDLAAIRALYAGSGGGTGFDISWAQNSAGQDVNLSAISFIRVDVLTGKSEIDAFAVVPEPSVWALALVGTGIFWMRRPRIITKCFFQGVAVISWFLCLPAVAETTTEYFAEDPLFNGWRIHGAEDLFHWNSLNQNLDVTWDSARPNSFFYRPLGTVLTKSDDFSFAFALRFQDIQVGVNPSRPFTFQATIGFLNLAQATSTNFARGAGINPANGPRNVIEFDYFPDSGFGATISPTIISSNNQFATTFNFPIELTTNDWFRVLLSYTATNQTLATDIQRNGQPFNPIKEVVLDRGFSDFCLDSFAVSSYNDEGADGSILAHGTVDNFQITTPEPPLARVAGAFTKGLWQLECVTRTNWFYTLERTTNFESWTTVSPRESGTGTSLSFQDAAVPGDHAFYRVRGERP